MLLLLAQKPNAIQHTLRSIGRLRESLAQVAVLTLEGGQTLRRRLGTGRGSIELLQLRLSLQRPAPEARQLLTKTVHEGLELLESRDLGPRILAATSAV